MGDRGSVVAYNAQFEKGVLDACGEVLPEFGPWVAGIKRRVRRQLEQYCGLDTEGRVRIFEALMRVASAAG